MTKVHITLVSVDGSMHAGGLIDLMKIQDTHLVEHNKRLYYFKPSSTIGKYVFEECRLPYIIMEF